LAVDRRQLTAVTKALSTANGQLLTVGFNRRFAPLIQNLKSSIVNRAGVFSLTMTKTEKRKSSPLLCIVLMKCLLQKR
ncbi:MAG: hypothetical protein Q7J80_15100, partial [Anaerolineales bacterium]|nr:hypothetical protein [Anaerolineales bacterium]